VQYPKSCCKELAAVISAVTGLERYLLKFERVPDLPLKPQWTSKQARVMAKRRYRSRYLP
jgi:gamma-glutamylcysteine synthetase